MLNKLAADHPEWPFTMMADSWRNFREYIVQVTYTNPENFDMVIGGDFHGYGAFQILENQLIDIDEARDDKDVDRMWSIVATMGLALSSRWRDVDDD